MDGSGFEMSFGSLDLFFGGLEALVGSPHPNVKEMMGDEHTSRGDSGREFTTGNYGVRTTSAIEYQFVVAPDKYDLKAAVAMMDPRAVAARLERV